MILKIPSEEVAPCYTLFCTVDTVYTIDFVYIVFNTIQTPLQFLNSSMYAYIIYSIYIYSIYSIYIVYIYIVYI